MGVVLTIMSSRSHVRYSRLVPPVPVRRDRNEADYRDDQFTEPPPKIPVKSIVLAVLLFLMGATLLTLAGLMLGGVFGDTPDASATPFLILGLVTFIPGFYHVRIAYYAFRGYSGYSYFDIPHYDD